MPTSPPSRPPLSDPRAPTPPAMSRSDDVGGVQSTGDAPTTDTHAGKSCSKTAMKYRTPTTVRVSASVVEGKELSMCNLINGYSMSVSPTERASHVYEKVQAHLKKEAESRKQAHWPPHAFVGPDHAHIDRSCDQP